MAKNGHEKTRNNSSPTKTITNKIVSWVSAKQKQTKKRLKYKRENPKWTLGVGLGHRRNASSDEKPCGKMENQKRKDLISETKLAHSNAIGRGKKPGLFCVTNRVGLTNLQEFK